MGTMTTTNAEKIAADGRWHAAAALGEAIRPLEAMEASTAVAFAAFAGNPEVRQKIVEAHAAMEAARQALARAYVGAMEAARE